MGKVVCVRLPDDQIWSDFQAYVALKNGRVKGSLGAEVANALREYLENRRFETARAHTYTANNAGLNVGSRTLRNLREITRRVLEATAKEIPQACVERIITEVAGGEWRTLRRYGGLLRDYGILEPVRRIHDSGKFIFEVKLDEAKKLVGISP